MEWYHWIWTVFALLIVMSDEVHVLSDNKTPWYKLLGMWFVTSAIPILLVEFVVRGLSTIIKLIKLVN